MPKLGLEKSNIFHFFDLLTDMHESSIESYVNTIINTFNEILAYTKALVMATLGR